MALHKNFPKDKFAIAPANTRWFPAEEDLREKGGYERLLPPLVAQVREEVQEWRDSGYDGASETSKALLKWWFLEPHTKLNADGTSSQFQYYFAQREAVETIIWLYDVAKTRSKHDLIRFDKVGRLSGQMFAEDWLRMVIKMATGSGKTKVMSLIIVWAYSSLGFLPTQRPLHRGRLFIALYYFHDRHLSLPGLRLHPMRGRGRYCMKRTALKRYTPLKSTGFRRPLPKPTPKTPPKLQNKGYTPPNWFKAIKPGSHGSTPSQKRLWRVVSETYREADWKEWPHCRGCGKQLASWKDGQLGHFKRYSLCNAWMKVERKNLLTICAACNFIDDGPVYAAMAIHLEEKYGPDIIEWIEDQNLKMKGQKMQEWAIVDYAARIAPHLVDEK